MAYSFRSYTLDQAYLLPQAPREWLPEGHLAFFLEETVSLLDLKPILDRHQFFWGFLRTACKPAPIFN